MTDGLHINALTFLRLIGWALVLILIVRGLRLLLQLAPMSSARRRSFEQALPMVELLVGSIYLLSAVQILFAGQPLLGAVAVLGVVFGGLWLARHALMDLMTGVFLRASGSVARGDRVRVDGIDGQVSWLGTRSLAVETVDGDEALVPYSRLAGQAVVRTPRIDGAHRHTFRVPAVEGAGAGAGADRIRQLAMLCHWSSVARPPVVRATEDGNHEVTVFALAASRGSEVEAFVRKGLR